jgi:hypothetical protein
MVKKKSIQLSGGELWVSSFDEEVAGSLNDHIISPFLEPDFSPETKYPRL